MRVCAFRSLRVSDLLLPESHKGWVKDIEETQGVNLTYPIVAGMLTAILLKLSHSSSTDSDRKVAQLYNMLDQTNLDAPGTAAIVCRVIADLCTLPGLPLTVRSVFIVDPNKKIRLIITYPAR